MKKLILLTFLFISFLCEAQMKLAVIEWEKTIGGDKYEYLKKITKASDGGFILAGSSNSGISSEKSVPTYGLFDCWVCKIDDNGKILWQKSYGGLKNDFIIDIIPTFDSGYVFLSTSGSSISGNKTQNSNGGFDYWVVKINKNGDIQWQKTLGTAYRDYASCITSTNDNGFIIGGYTIGGISRTKTTANKGDFDYWILKLNRNGNIVWQNSFGGDQSDYLKKLVTLDDSSVLLIGDSNSSAGSFDKTLKVALRDIWLVKVNNSNGSKIIDNTITPDVSYRNYDYRVKSATLFSNDVYIGSSIENFNTYNANVSKYWTSFRYGTSWEPWVYDPSFGTVNLQENPIIDTTYALNNFEYPHEGTEEYNSITFNEQDTTVLYFGVQAEYAGKTNFRLSKYTSGFGTIGFTSEIQRRFNGTYTGTNKINLPGGLTKINNNEFIVGFTSDLKQGFDKYSDPRGATDFWILRIRFIDNPDSIRGIVYQDQNTNCIQESNENGIPNVIVKTEPSNFFGISDTLGKYTILTDTGVYKVKPLYPQILKPFLTQNVCPTQGYHSVSFSQYGQDTSEINFANYEKQCPFLQLELSQGRMRRCFDNNATIKYCNIGNVDTNNVQVIVQLPEYVTFVSSSNPNYTINGKTITFTIGNLRANECGTINLVTNVDCVEGIVGLTQCIKAYILPRNKCVDQIQPDYALWDKSEITVDGNCTNSTVRFVIKNVGQSMADSSNYRIYKNAVQALSKNFKLVAGDSLVINVSATGHTFRLEADQTIHYPTTSSPNITIENCNNTNTANRGFVNQQEQDKSEQNVERLCLEIRDSYDPNDKQVFPSGVGIDKRVRHQVPLEFLIRFQNTGTDTAYKVLITDTLNQNLDLSTLEFGASSHPYKFEFTGAGRPIMKFTFDKINLVDSFTNEPKSHGFISFKITPYDSIPNGTLVKNNADIYFDFNLPIKTNIAQVSIDDRLPTGATLNLVTSTKQHQNNYEAIYVYPNPFSQTTTFEFVYNSKASQLIIYDLKGELVSQETIANKTNHQLQRNNLPNGMYFYNIQNSNGEIIGRGKLVLQ